MIQKYFVIFKKKTPNAYKYSFQNLFHSLYIEFFSHFPHVLVHYRFSYMFVFAEVLQSIYTLKLCVIIVKNNFKYIQG